MQNTRTRTAVILVVVLAIVIGLNAGRTVGADQSGDAASESDAATPASHSVVQFEGDPSLEERRLIAWAVGRFMIAGLELPDLTIAFLDECSGKGGRYFVGQGRIELCNPSRTLVLHEMAHAWEDVHRIDREAFMDLRQTDSWYENGHTDATRKLTGGEQLAIIMAWGLHDTDTMSRHIVDPALPIDQQPRYLSDIPNSDPDTLRHAFSVATGVDAIVP